jgi:hypothetical protein
VEQPRRYPFATPEWLAAFHAVLASAVAASVAEQPDLTFSMAELSLGPDLDIAAGGAMGGWSCFVQSGRIVRFEAGAAADVDYSVVGPYAVMKELCCFQIAGDRDRARQFKALNAKYYEAGVLRVTGVQPRLPRPFALVHDTVAGLTA